MYIISFEKANTVLKWAFKLNSALTAAVMPDLNDCS
jgi:hypothetical protein